MFDKDIKMMRDTTIVMHLISQCEGTRFVKGGPTAPGRLMETKWYRRPSTLPLVVTAMALMIIIIGGTIRVLDAGESCPDWPQCFGTWGFSVSEDDQGAWYDQTGEYDSRGTEHRYSTFEIFSEWAHRFLASIMAIPVLATFLIVLNKKETYGSDLVKTSFFAGILLIVQGGAGYLTVRYDNVDWSVALHLVLALSFVSILLWNWFQMRRAEGFDWPMFKAPSKFVHSELKRFKMLSSAILILLVLGAWVASTAGGNFNQGCSVGFPRGWPQCQGQWFPSFDGPGIIVQMFHRIGAGLVGMALILGSMKIRESTDETGAHFGFGRCFDLATGFWLLNVFVGGLYIVFASVDSFPESLSLLHLAIGVSSFLSAMIGTMLLMIAKNP
jgi:cytochrome c oxidase assembly protein subunit 15